MVEKDMLGERKLWATVISQGITDLRSRNDKHIIRAALYFFTEGDETNLKTFNGICKAHNLDSNKAAQRIWGKKLKPEQQERIKKLLRKFGHISPAWIN